MCIRYYVSVYRVLPRCIVYMYIYDTMILRPPPPLPLPSPFDTPRPHLANDWSGSHVKSRPCCQSNYFQLSSDITDIRLRSISFGILKSSLQHGKSSILNSVIEKEDFDFGGSDFTLQRFVYATKEYVERPFNAIFLNTLYQRYLTSWLVYFAIRITARGLELSEKLRSPLEFV